MLDLVIRNGTIVDGSGLPRFRGDVGVRDRRIASVGRLLGDAEAARDIDAAGKIVAPGFIDPHTHYDAQLCFDPYAYPAIEHGVTSVILGNCSLSLAPVRAAHRERFSRMYRLIEEMPEAAFDQGVDWRWGESFGSMLNSLAGDIALNVGALVGHSVLRMYVLGDDPRRAASVDEVATMCEVLRGCLDAGALGLSTSYVDVEDDLLPVPCRFAEHRELEALCAVLAERGRMLQVVHEFYDPGLTVSRIEMLADLSIRFGIPTTLSPLFHSAATPDGADQVMAAVERVWAEGARVWPQVQTRPIDISWTMGQRSIMFLAIPGWWNVLAMNDPAAKLAALADPNVKQTLVEGMEQAVALRGPGMDPANYLVRDVALERNRDLVGRTLGEIAAERGTRAAELLIDLSVEEELGTWFVRAELGHSDAVAVGALLAHPLVHIGASDGGAHVGSFATYGDTGFLLSRYVRETGALSLEGAVKKITSDAAAIWGIPERGELRPRFAADIVVFDADTVGRGPEIAEHDFPGGGTRWIRRAEGVDTVIVNGAITWTAADGYVAGARAGTITVPA